MHAKIYPKPPTFPRPNYRGFDTENTDQITPKCGPNTRVCACITDLLRAVEAEVEAVVGEAADLGAAAVVADADDGHLVLYIREGQCVCEEGGGW